MPTFIRIGQDLLKIWRKQIGSLLLWHGIGILTEHGNAS